MGRWTLQASPLDKLWLVVSLVNKGERSRWRKNLNHAKMFHPQSRDHSATGNMLELQTDGDRRNVHSGRGIVFGDNFTQILLAATAEHLPDRQTPALFRFHSDLILTYNGSFFRCLLELLLVPWPACPRSPYCMIACQWCMLPPCMCAWCTTPSPHFYLLKAHRHCLYFVMSVFF